MRIVLTGASGGIGRPLIALLAKKHEVVGVVRSTRRPVEGSTVRYVAYADQDALRRELAEADVVIHTAIDRTKIGKEFIALNLQMTRDLLDMSLGGKCRQFIFFSSQVVYSGIDPIDEAGYTEDQQCVVEGVDDYSRLKVLSEPIVIDACRKAEVPYLILRPTIVLGPGLVWTEATPKISKWLPIGIKSRYMNLIHVDDLCVFVDRLIDLKAANEIFNLGTEDYPSEAFFNQVGAQISRKIYFLSEGVVRFLGKAMPSSVWFYKSNVKINCEKVQQVTGVRVARPISELFPDVPVISEGDSLPTLQGIQKSAVPFKAFGAGYSLTLSPRRRAQKEQRVLMRPYQGIVSLNGDLVTVKAGTFLSEITTFLDQVDLTLPTLPEFSGLTAGACFFVEVHGSSRDYFSLYELITEIKYLDASGNVVVSKRDEVEWDRLRQRESDIFLTEITFKCEPAGYLANRIEWKDDDVLAEYVRDTHRKNLSTTVQWYPLHKKVFIYNINRVDAPPAKFTEAKLMYRHSPYGLQKMIVNLRMRGTDTQYDRYADILSPWKDIPLRKYWYKAPLSSETKTMAIEMCLSLEDGAEFVRVLQSAIRSGKLDFFTKNTTIGFRFSYRTNGEQESKGFVWVEWIADKAAAVDEFVSLAKGAAKEGISFHHGKHIPDAYLA